MYAVKLFFYIFKLLLLKITYQERVKENRLVIFTPATSFLKPGANSYPEKGKIWFSKHFMLKK